MSYPRTVSGKPPFPVCQLSDRVIRSAASKIVNRLRLFTDVLGETEVSITLSRLAGVEVLDVHFRDTLDVFIFRGRRLYRHPYTRAYWGLAGCPIRFIRWCATLPALTGDRFLMPRLEILREIKLLEAHSPVQEPTNPWAARSKEEYALATHVSRPSRIAPAGLTGGLA